MFYFIVTRFYMLYLKITRGLKIYNRENIPKKGAFLLISNHISNDDPFVLACSTNRPLTYMAKDNLFKNIFGRIFFRLMHTYPIDRNGDPREVLNQFIDFLKAGKPSVMFPEGTRNKVDDNPAPFKKGAALVAIKAGVPVVPMAVLGTNHKKARILAICGEVVMPPVVNNKSNLNEFNELLAQRVNELIEELRKLQ